MLSVENISKFYAGKTALEGVSLTVGPGQIYGLLGPNGAGKTSLIRIITMITAPDKGEVKLENKRLSSEMISEIGYLPEERGLYKKMKILDQALYFARLKGVEKQEALKRIHDWFEKLDMLSWKDKKTEELSKGMQQKVQFVLTVLHRPRLIILDEPFTGFDPVNAEIIKNEILSLKKQGATIILSTHRMESVEELCDEISLIHRSRVILQGSVRDIRQQHKKHLFELVHKRDLPPLPGMSIREQHVEAAENTRKTVLGVEPGVSGNMLLAAVMPHVEVVSFREIIPSVKDIFIELVGNEL
jgi:ABC-2 type transport system ATP-binding protein